MIAYLSVHGDFILVNDTYILVHMMSPKTSVYLWSYVSPPHFTLPFSVAKALKPKIFYALLNSTNRRTRIAPPASTLQK